MLIYAVAEDAPLKRLAARAVVDLGVAGEEIVLSSQVLQEFASNLVGKARLPLSRVRDLVLALPTHRLITIDSDLVVQSISLIDRYQLSYWDACIVAAAQLADCRVLYSEDLQHGMKFGTLRVVNPFL